MRSNAEAICLRLGIVLNKQQRIACRYLEENGFEFCLDYGYSNAVNLAVDHCLRRMEEER